MGKNAPNFGHRLRVYKDAEPASTYMIWFGSWFSWHNQSCRLWHSWHFITRKHVDLFLCLFSIIYTLIKNFNGELGRFGLKIPKFCHNPDIWQYCFFFFIFQKPAKNFCFWTGPLGLLPLQQLTFPNISRDMPLIVACLKGRYIQTFKTDVYTIQHPNVYITKTKLM